MGFKSSTSETQCERIVPFFDSSKFCDKVSKMSDGSQLNASDMLPSTFTFFPIGNSIPFFLVYGISTAFDM